MEGLSSRTYQLLSRSALQSRQCSTIYRKMPFAFEILIACSGPGAIEAIMKSNALAKHVALMVAGVIACSLLLSLKRKEFKRKQTIPFFMLLIHPAWTMSAIRGDCGFMKREASHLFTLIALSILAWQIIGYVKNEGFRLTQTPSTK